MTDTNDTKTKESEHHDNGYENEKDHEDGSHENLDTSTSLTESINIISSSNLGDSTNLKSSTEDSHGSDDGKESHESKKDKIDTSTSLTDSINIKSSNETSQGKIKDKENPKILLENEEEKTMLNKVEAFHPTISKTKDSVGEDEEEKNNEKGVKKPKESEKDKKKEEEKNNESDTEKEGKKTKKDKKKEEKNNESDTEKEVKKTKESGKDEKNKDEIKETEVDETKTPINDKSLNELQKGQILDFQKEGDLSKTDDKDQNRNEKTQNETGKKITKRENIPDIKKNQSFIEITRREDMPTIYKSKSEKFLQPKSIDSKKEEKLGEENKENVDVKPGEQENILKPLTGKNQPKTSRGIFAYLIGFGLFVILLSVSFLLYLFITEFDESSPLHNVKHSIFGKKVEDNKEDNKGLVPIPVEPPAVKPKPEPPADKPKPKEPKPDNQIVPATPNFFSNFIAALYSFIRHRYIQ